MSHKKYLLPLAFSLLLCVGFRVEAQSQPSAKSPTLTYIKDIKPLLKDRCIVCHNREALKNPALSGGLALDTFAGLREGIKGKSPFVSGKSAESALFKRLSVTSPTLLMPRGGPPLSKEQIALVKQWIDSGAATGDLSKESLVVAKATLEPLPANVGLQDVVIQTKIAPTPDLREKTTPPNATLAAVLKVGPLPAITALAYSPDGSLLAVGTYHAVTLWDMKTAKPIACITEVQGAAQSVAFRPDGQVIAIACGQPGVSGEVRLYDVKAQKYIEPALTGHTDMLYSVAWSKDGKLLATGSHDKTARIWDASNGKELQALKEHSDAVSRVCFSPDGNTLYTASFDRNVRSFDVKDGKLIRSYTGSTEAIYALALSLDGKTLIAAGIDSTMRWWNADDGNNFRNTNVLNKPVNEIALSRDGKFFVAADGEGKARYWNAENGNYHQAFEGDSDWLYSVAISPDGKSIAAAGADGLVRIWQKESYRLRLYLASWYPAPKTDKQDWIAVTPEGYFAASPTWEAKSRLTLASKDLSPTQIKTLRPLLLSSENVQKALEGKPIDPFKMPDPPAKPQPPKAAPEKAKGAKGA